MAEAVECVRRAYTHPQSRETIENQLLRLAKNRTIGCRNAWTGEPGYPTRRAGPSGLEPLPPIELDRADLASVVADIRTRETERADEVAALGNGRADDTAKQPAGTRGRRLKAALPAAMVEATLKLTYEGTATQSEVARWIAASVEAHNESISPSQAAEYAAIVLKLHKASQSTGK
jgi:hypothetical protein